VRQDNFRKVLFQEILGLVALAEVIILYSDKWYIHVTVTSVENLKQHYHKVAVNTENQYKRLS